MEKLEKTMNRGYEGEKNLYGLKVKDKTQKLRKLFKSFWLV